MLEAKDVIGYSSLRNSSSYYSFKSLFNVRQECYKSLRLGQCLVCLSYLRYYSYFCKLLLPKEVVKFKALLEDPLYKFSNVGLAGIEQAHYRVISA
jgi:hypothetical protein